MEKSLSLEWRDISIMCNLMQMSPYEFIRLILHLFTGFFTISLNKKLSGVCLCSYKLKKTFMTATGIRGVDGKSQ